MILGARNGGLYDQRAEAILHLMGKIAGAFGVWAADWGTIDVIARKTTKFH